MRRWPQGIGGPIHTQAKMPTSHPVAPLATASPDAVPELWWQPDSAAECCSRCRAKFSILVRRHHCRGCGFIFCRVCAPAGLGKTHLRLCAGCKKLAPEPPTVATPARVASPEDEDCNPARQTASKSAAAAVSRETGTPGKLHARPEEPPLRPVGLQESGAIGRWETPLASPKKPAAVPGHRENTDTAGDGGANEKDTSHRMLSHRLLCPFSSSRSPPPPLKQPLSEPSPAQTEETKEQRKEYEDEAAQQDKGRANKDSAEKGRVSPAEKEAAEASKEAEGLEKKAEEVRAKLANSDTRMLATAVFVCSGLMLASQTVLGYFSGLMALVAVLEVLCSQHSSPALLWMKRLATWACILLSVDLWLGSLRGGAVSTAGMPQPTKNAAAMVRKAVNKRMGEEGWGEGVYSHLMEAARGGGAGAVF